MESRKSRRGSTRTPRRRSTASWRDARRPGGDALAPGTSAQAEAEAADLLAKGRAGRRGAGGAPDQRGPDGGPASRCWPPSRSWWSGPISGRWKSSAPCRRSSMWSCWRPAGPGLLHGTGGGDPLPGTGRRRPGRRVPGQRAAGQEAAPELPLGDGAVASFLNKVAANVSALVQGTAMLTLSEETRAISRRLHLCRTGGSRSTAPLTPWCASERERDRGSGGKAAVPGDVRRGRRLGEEKGHPGYGLSGDLRPGQGPGDRPADRGSGWSSCWRPRPTRRR